MRHRTLAMEHPERSLSLALGSITGDDAAGYYRHAGFDVKTAVLVPGVLNFYEKAGF